MAKSIVIRDVVYPDVPAVDIPLSAGGGNATFTDTSDATLDNGNKMRNGVTGYGANGVKYTGSMTENPRRPIRQLPATKPLRRISIWLACRRSKATQIFLLQT